MNWGYENFPAACPCGGRGVRSITVDGLTMPADNCPRCGTAWRGEDCGAFDNDRGTCRKPKGHVGEHVGDRPC